MDWFKTTIDRALEGSVDIPTMISNNQLYFAFTSGVTPDLSDTGHEFLADLLNAGGTVETEAQLTPASWSARQLDSTASELTIPDPGGGTTATWAVLYQKTGNNSTARVLAAQDITDLTFDGTDDTLGLPSPILEVQA
mgnify:CR=1 FL=1